MVKRARRYRPPEEPTIALEQLNQQTLVLPCC
ncbi:hypothetical protein ACNKHX_02520 [Shigella flexneri]